ncbi:phage tail tape measure protein [Undibacterium rugosum]|uniref:phage tail tape measure protein n=1 Tax=Undibacterium rugosum TaxID=2762291 RepID=UPI001E54DDE1|nr:phage tail protein [Undibacterium rugosum]
MMEKITAPLKRIIGESSASGKALKTLRDRLKDLDTQQKNVTGFRQLHTGLRETASRLEAARQRVKTLAEQMQATENPTRTMTREFDRATKAARLIKEQHQQQSQHLQALRDKLNGAGISTRDLAQHERSLRNSIAETNAQITAQQHKLTELAKRHEQVSAAKKRMEQTRANAGNMAATGIGMTMTGVAMGAPVIKSLNEAKHFETEIQRIHALGMGDKISNDAIKFSQAMKTYGTSSLENLELMRDSLTVFADLHHAEMVLPTLAKMKFANAAMYREEEGAEKGQTFMNMLKVIELRGGLASKDKFEHEANLVQKVLTATGGRVGPNEWLNFIKTGGVAAKSLKDEAFFYKMEPLIQEMGGNRVGTGLMSAYANLYQGHTTVRAAQEMGRLDLLDPTKVEYNKIGMIKQIKPGALAGGDMLKSDPMAWLETVLLPKLAAKGITEQEQIKDAIATIMTNRTASNLFTQMYLQREQIHKNERLNAGAADIDTTHKRAKTTAHGQEIEALSRIHSAQKEIGEQVLPVYSSALQKLASILSSVTGFMKEHTTTTKILTVSFASLAAVLLVMGGLTVVLASLIGPFAILRYAMTLLGMKGGILSAVMARTGAVFSRVGSIIARLSGWFRAAIPALRIFSGAMLVAMRSVLSFGAALLANPIGLVIVAIALLAAGAYYLYKNWAPATRFFDGIWAEIKGAFSGGVWGVTTLLLNWSLLGILHRVMAGVLSWFGIDIPAKFTEFGANMMHGLVNGITAAASTVRETISSMADNVTAWFKEKLGIHSPSVVFAELGQFTMQGLSIGLQQGERQPLAQVNSLVKRMTALGSGLAFSAAMAPAMAFDMPAIATQAPMNFDRRPPLASANAAPAQQHHSTNTYQITINPSPGMDPQAIAKAVAAELDKRERQRTLAKRSSMHDYDEF